MLILGIESTCDETGVAVVEDGVKIKSNFIASSVSKLAKYGGIVPEVVAREQVKFIIPLVKKSLGEIGIDKIDVIAVSYGPGLIGSLLVGVETAKALAFAWDKRLITVNHLVGHIYSNWLKVDSSPIRQAQGKQFTEKEHKKRPEFPLVALIVSGGHTDLVLMRSHGNFNLLGSTLDDAAGEAFDKVARVLGLGYPGGPEIELIALKHKIQNSKFKIGDVKFPRAMMNSDDFNFSFSGIKTAVATIVNSRLSIVDRRTEIAYEFQEAVCDVLVAKTVSAAKKFGARSIVVGGGVSANGRLRSQFSVHGSQLGIELFFPPKNLSVDNGAMIAAAAFYNQNFVDPIKLSANPNLHF